MAKILKTLTIYIVDHDLENLFRFRRYFADQRVLVYYLRSFQEAQAVMVGVIPDIVICRIDSSDCPEVGFLETIQDNFPHAIRIIVSDEQNRDMLLTLLVQGLAQRFLCFPWQKNNITEILERDITTRSKIRANPCWNYLEKGRTLPAIPSIVREIERVIGGGDYSLGQISRIIEQEPTIALRLLQIANSAAFTKRGTVSDLGQAISFIGIDNLREILLFICALDGFSYEKGCMQMVKGIARHSFLCSRLSMEIASEIDPGNEREAATAALLHDTGKLIMLAKSGSRLIKAVNLLGDNGHLWPDRKFEEENFGFRYTEVGSCLLLLWNLPMSLIETVAGIEYPLRELTGSARSVAIADRCLQEAAAREGLDLELETMIPALPVMKWRTSARELVDSPLNFT